MKSDYQPLQALRLARAAAEQAGEILRRGYQSGSEVRADSGKDIKLDADTRAEAVILAALREESPFPILSEEAGADEAVAAAGLCWVVDPLDGTFNFSRRLPLCCVSIGLCDGERPVLGVIHDFLAGGSYQIRPGSSQWQRQVFASNGRFALPQSESLS